VIAFRFIPNTVVTGPVEAVWGPFVHKPWFSLPYWIRLAIGWACLLAIVFGSAFGFPLTDVGFVIDFFLLFINPYNPTGHDIWGPRNLCSRIVCFPVRILPLVSGQETGSLVSSLFQWARPGGYNQSCTDSGLLSSLDFSFNKSLHYLF